MIGGYKSGQKRDIEAALKNGKRSGEGQEMTATSVFDVSEFLNDDELIAEYLAAAMEDENPDVFIGALGDVAKARGMAEIAKASGLGRESLYKSLRGGSKARFETLRKVVNTLGLKMTIVSSGSSS